MLRPSASSPLSVELRVGDRLARLHALADVHDRPLVDACALVAAHELLEPVLVELALVGLDRDPLGVTLVTTPGAEGDDDLAGVARGALLHAGADDRRLGLEERHGLALHVRAHQGAVRVVVLEERDQRRRHRDDLLGRDVHVLDLVGASLGERVAVAGRDALGDEVALSSRAALACATWCSSSSSAAGIRSRW